MVPIPPQKTHPTWNIDDLFKHAQEVPWIKWLLVLLIEVDYQTMGLKGHHQDKRIIEYKEESDVFQMDAIYDHEFNYVLYLCSQSPTTKNDIAISPLHAKFISLFDTLSEDLY